VGPGVIGVMEAAGWIGRLTAVTAYEQGAQGLWEGSWEAELVQRAQSFEHEALGILYQHFYPRLYNYAYLHLGEIHRAQDLASDVMLKVLEALPRYRQRGVPFAAWVFRIARNRLIDEARRNRRRKQEPLAEDLPDGGPSAHTLAERSADRQRLRQALADLTEDQRQVVILRFIVGMETAAVARALGRGEGAVKALQHRALLALRKRLREDSG